MRLVPYFLSAFLCVSAVNPCLSQTKPADAVITITGVEGLVQVREDENKPWQKAAVGMTVSPGAEFRTGPRSAVRCSIGDGQTFTVDRLGTIKVFHAIEQSGTVKTDLLMKYGRTRYDVEAAGVEHKSTITSPSATLAVRGTKVSLYDQPPFKTQATSLTGRATYTSAKRQIALGAAGGTKASAEGTQTAAETAANASIIQSVFASNQVIGMNQAESRQLAMQVARGGFVFDRLAIGGFLPPPDDFAKEGLLVGRLNFVVAFTGFADVDLFVIQNPSGGATREILGNPSIATAFPGFVKQQTSTGGRIDFDHVSVLKGDYEIAYWSADTWTPGTYGIGAIHQDFRDKPGYDNSSNLRFEVYLDGQKLPTVLTNPEAVNNDASPIFGTEYRTTTNLAQGNSTAATVVIVPDPNPRQVTRSARSPKRAAAAAAKR